MITHRVDTWTDRDSIPYRGDRLLGLDLGHVVPPEVSTAVGAELWFGLPDRNS